MFFRKDFLFYLPRLDKYKIVKARNKSTAIWKLINAYRLREIDIENFVIIENFDIIK